MKIASPSAHQPTHLPPVTPPTGRSTVPAQAPDGQFAQTVALKDSRLAQQGQLALKLDQSVIFTGLKSQAKVLQERSQKLVAQYARGLNTAARDLRKQIKNRPLGNPEATLLDILASCDDNPAVAHCLLHEAARQARDEVEDSEYLFIKRQLKLLRKERGKPSRGSASPTRNRAGLRAQAPYRPDLDAIYAASVSGPASVLGLVEALLGEMRTHGEYEGSLRKMRADMADHLAAAVSSNALSQTRPLIGGLTTARQVAALLKECEHLLGRMRRKNPELRIEAIALLRHLLTLIGTLMAPDQTRTLVELIGGKHLRNQLACLNEIKRILNQRLPVQLLRTKNGFSNLRTNMLILSTALTNEEQQMAQENIASWNA